jgi:hypothetical protein
MPSDSYNLTISDVGISTPATDSVTNASVAAGAAIAFSKLATLTSGNILVGNSSNIPTSVAVTGDVTVSNAGVVAIASGAIVNADVNASAAIAHSKLASLTSGNIIVGNSSNVPTAVAVTGDITVSNAGVTAIASGAVVDADINASAAIAYSKLASLASGNILVGSSVGVPTSVALTGDVAISNTGVASIAAGAIVNADVNASAAIAYSKLAPLTSGYILVGSNLGVLTPVAVTGDVTISNTGVTSLQAGLTLVTPILGTPAAGSFLTNCTGLPLTTGVTGTLPAANGGTGQSSYAIGDITYASGSTTLAKLADVATGNVLLSGGVGTAPAYGKVGLTTHVDGSLPAANGGTGQTSYAIGDIIYASGATALSKLADVATGNTLLSGGVGVAPAYGKVGLTTHVDGTLPVANGGTNQVSVARGQISKMTSFTAVTVSSTGTYYPLTNGGTLDTTVSTNMILGATSTFSIRNTSGATRVFRIYASVDATASADDILGIMLYAGAAGSLSARVETECRAYTNTVNDAAKLVTSWMIPLANNEEVAVYVANHSATQNITAQRARIVAEAVL